MPHILNALLPRSIRTVLRHLAVETIPSMRHLDMPKRLQHLRSLSLVPPVIYDVGAAQGKWAELAASIWPEARIIGFEPNQSNIPKLEGTKQTLPMFEYLACFLGPQRQFMHYTPQGNQTSLYNVEIGSQEKTTAEMLVLDELIAENRIPPPNFIKLDVQGYELEVLRGGEKAMASCDAILIEVSFTRTHPQMPLVDEVIDFLKARQFRWFDVMGILRDPTHDMLWQMDLCFLKNTHPCWDKQP